MEDQGGVDMESLIVACFHESNGSPQTWPLETELVRRAIRARIEDALLPEIVAGEYAYWQWDLWIFCAGSRSTFVMAEDLSLLLSALSKDGETIPLKNNSEVNYTRISSVAGNEMRMNMRRINPTEVQVSAAVVDSLPPLEIEEISGDRDGMFMTKAYYLQPSSLLDEGSREERVRQSLQITLSMRKRTYQPINSLSDPIMVFGPAVGPYHILKRGDGMGIQHINMTEIESYTDADLDILIGVEHKRPNGTTVVLKYMVKSKPIAALAMKAAAKCMELARQKPAWEVYKLGQTRMGHLTNSCDAPFTSEYCVISGIKMEYFKSDNSEALLVKLRKAAKGMITPAVPSEGWLLEIKNKKRRHLRLSNMGWSFGLAKDREKAFILIKLEHPLLVGITMYGGRGRYERVVASNLHDEAVEWWSRQFVTTEEANFLLNVERRTTLGDVNVMMGGARGLTRISEFDECLLRVTKNKYESQFQGDIGAFMMTISHDWPKDSSELKEEPIIVVCQLGAFKGGDLLGRSFQPFEKGYTTIRQPVGSMEIQLFLRLDQVLNKPFRSATNSWMMEVDNCPRACHMMVVIDRLKEAEAKKAYAVIRIDSNKRTSDVEKWCVLLDSRAHTNGEMREEGTIMLKESAIISPTRRRSRASSKSFIKWDDEVNLRFFDRNDQMHRGSKDRTRSSSSSRNRFPEAPKEETSAIKSGKIFSGRNNHPDYLNVPDYYKMDIPKKAVPLSLTASPGICSLSMTSTSGTTSTPSTAGSFSSLSTASARSPGARAPKAKEEIELCKLFLTGNCIRGVLYSYRHETQETGLSKPNGRKG